MHIVSLASSSTCGNAYVIWEDSKRPLLIDCGLSIAKLVSGLRSLGITPDDLAGLFLTHEHTDHVRAMCLKTPFPQKFGIPVYASGGFWDWYSTYQCRHLDAELIHLVEDGMTTDIAGYRVRSFLKPHDAREPMGFKVDGSSASAAFVMDLGYVPPSAEQLLRGAEYLVFESNHDLDMEINSGRPKFLIDRVIGEFGHLSNEQAADSLSRLVTASTRQVILAHLSVDCNRPEIAVSAVMEKLQDTPFRPQVTAAPSGTLTRYGT